MSLKWLILGNKTWRNILVFYAATTLGKGTKTNSTLSQICRLSAFRRCPVRYTTRTCLYLASSICSSGVAGTICSTVWRDGRGRRRRGEWYGLSSRSTARSVVSGKCLDAQTRQWSWVQLTVIHRIVIGLASCQAPVYSHKTGICTRLYASRRWPRLLDLAPVLAAVSSLRSRCRLFRSQFASRRRPDRVVALWIKFW